MNSKKIIRILLHLAFWVINYLLVFADNLSWNGFTKENLLLPISYAYGLTINALLFYAQSLWLVPKYYIKNKKHTFWLLTICILLFASLIEASIDTMLGKSYELYKSYDFYGNSTGVILFAWFFYNLIFHFLYTIAGFFYQFRAEYRKAEKAKQELLKETYETELKYLKAQLNPHFLFNGINSVYHLIGKNNALAKNTLLQFSSLLRYQLYESNTTHISLEKELEYLVQYIQLEDIRKGEDVTLNYEINYENSSEKIAPLLLIAFIENAFKHVSNHSNTIDNIISISIEEYNRRIVLNVENSFDELQIKKIGGVGLNNVKRRLELLYPEKHHLEISKENKLFKVSLKIDLS